MTNFDKLKKLIEITITPEGLRIELMEAPYGTFFENGSDKPTALLQSIVRILSSEIGKLPNSISIEGHTDSTPYSNSTIYSNWELSTDRANMARRLMETCGIRNNQVVQIRGYADHNLRNPLKPNDASNRRITVIIQYMDKQGQSTVVSNGTIPAATDLVTVHK
jgi:chemotaxis protein MotB